MGLFTHKKDLGELEEERDKMVIEEEIASHKANISEREAAVQELKARYGPKWKATLGLKGIVDLPTLRSFLSDAKKGLEGGGGVSAKPGRIMPSPHKYQVRA